MPLSPPVRILRSLTDRLFSGMAVGGIVLFILGVSGGAYWTLQRIDTAVRESVRRTLVNVLATTREASHHWATRQQALAANMAATEGLSSALEHLAVARAKGGVVYPNADESKALLEPAVRANGLDGFWIIGGDETTLLGWPDSLPANLPRFMIPAMEKALDGLATLSTFPGDLRTAPRAAAFAPIRNARGETVGVLAIALPARTELSMLAEQSHNRSLGQAYFFDRAGQILGTSDPEADSTGRGARLTPPRSHELTRMAQAATAGIPGIDLEGYSNHRGVRVVGTWEWDEQLGLGLAAEMDADQAYHVVETARSALIGAYVITVLLFLAVLASLLQSRRRAMALSMLQRRLAAVLESTTDPVCFADRDGRAFYVNDAGHALFANGLPGDLPATTPMAWTRFLLRPEALQSAAQAPARAALWSGGGDRAHGRWP